MNSTALEMGEDVQVLGTEVREIEGYATVVSVVGVESHLIVRKDDVIRVQDGLVTFRGRVSGKAEGRVTLDLYSPSEEYEATVPVAAVIDKHEGGPETLTPGNVYRSRPDNRYWLYDGEHFHDVEEFPSPVGRDAVPDLLDDLGSLSDNM